MTTVKRSFFERKRYVQTFYKSQGTQNILKELNETKPTKNKQTSTKKKNKNHKNQKGRNKQTSFVLSFII